MHLKPLCHKTSLDDLPIEIIPEIALHLDLDDIVSLQQTSKKFRESINSPVVWRALAKTYSARHFHIYQPQTGGFEDLTGCELHEWIRKRIVFDRVWKAQTLQPQLRALEVDRYQTIKLVPGGRWLVASSFDGAVRYYDLDSEEPWPKVLFQIPKGPNDGCGGHVSGFQIYTDFDASGRYFILGISTRGDPFPRTTPEWLHVWQVRIKDVDSLTAKWLASIPTTNNYSRRYSFAIGRHVVVRTREERGHSTVIDAYWWNQCSTTGVLRSRFLVPSDCDIIYLIGDDRILCVDTAEGINLYAIPDSDHIPMENNLEYHENNPCVQPLWSYSLPGGWHYSPLYHDGTTYRLVANTGQGIWGFTIPATKQYAPSVIQLSTFFNLLNPCVPGLFKTFSLCNADNSGIRTGYNWESSEDGNATMAYTRGEPDGTRLYSISRLGFDEESGRFVYQQRDKVVILDFLCR